MYLEYNFLHSFEYFCTIQATISTFDTSAVKQKCRLSLNLAREGEQRLSSTGLPLSNSGANGSPVPTSNDAYPATTETLHIRSQRDNANRGRLEQMEVTLSRYNL